MAVRSPFALLALSSFLLLPEQAFAQRTAPAAGDARPAPVHTNADSGDDDSTTDKRTVAEMLFYTARGLMDDNKFAKACKKFAESYRLDPAAGTLLNLAVCHEKEGRLASAWAEFRQSAAEAKRGNRPDREELARAAIARIEPDLPYLTIIVPKPVRVAGLTVQRNGVPMEDAAWETELPIDPGVNEITASAPLYKPEKKLVPIEKRQHITVQLDPLVLAPVVRPPPPFWTVSRTWGAIAIGAGVIAAGVGAGFGVAALNNKSSSDSGCPTFDGQTRCSVGGANANSSAQTDAWIADFGIGLGAAAIVGGGLLMLTGGAHEQSGPPAAPAAQGAWRLDVTGSSHGALGVLQTTF
jgi:hypothetical protein